MKILNSRNTKALTVKFGAANTGSYDQGFIYGSNPGAIFGYPVSSAGDVNGDGIPDIIISSFGWQGNGTVSNGMGVYIIYGNNQQGLSNIISIESYLDDITKGFKIHNSAGDGLGVGASEVGDINDDGIDDIVIGSIGTNGTGAAYVIYGSKGTLPNIISIDNYLNDISKGFKIYGSSNGDQFGHATLKAGDINDDGYDDLVIGALASPLSRTTAGTTYIIYGTRGERSSISSIEDYLDDNRKGFKVYGSSPGDAACIDHEFCMDGLSAGDINGDGINDVIIGASGVGSDHSNPHPGAVYVIYGNQKVFSNILSVESYLKDLKNGFKIYGSYSGDRFGDWSSVCDVNGDNIDDVIVGAPYASPEGNQKAGAAYIIYGSQGGLPHIYDIENYLNDVNRGFKIYGSSVGDRLGVGVSKAGDVNGDGLEDIIIGAWKVSPENKKEVGAAYIIYGVSGGLPNIPSIEGYLSDTSKGFEIYGASAGDRLGMSVSNIGDINGDGGSDVIVGAAYASPEGRLNTGAAYIIYGKPSQNAQHQQNYGMISQINDFIPMNLKNNVGKIAIGDGKWCNANSLYVGDFNGDGKSDLLCNLSNGANYIMFSEVMAIDGVQFVSADGDKNGRINIGANANWCDTRYQQLLVGDFNNDKKSDLLCHNNANPSDGQNYVMLSIGNDFVPIGKSPDGAVSIGTLGTFCTSFGRLVVGNFDGIFGDDLLCNHPTGGNMLMISYKDDVGNIGFKSVNTDPIGLITMGNDGGCLNVWCEDIANTRLLPGNFDGDKKTDLLCNANDKNGDGRNLIMLSRAPKDPNSPNCDFNSISAEGGTKPDGYIAISKRGMWCSHDQMLKTGDINGDGKNDLLCNVLGINKIMLCASDDAQKSQYYFKSFNASAPAGDDGTTYIATQRVWCTAQHIVMGDYDGKTFNNNTICDLLCNQDSDVLGASVIEEIL